MSTRPPKSPDPDREQSLDPEDWDGLRNLGRRMLDDMLAYQADQRAHPVWRPLPDELRESFRSPIPRQGQGAEAVYEEFLERVLPYGTGNAHPRYWGWVRGNGTPLGMLAEMLAAGMNPNLTGQSQAPVLVEQQVIDWLKELFGFPTNASGLLLSGGSMANLSGLTVARNARSGYDLREEGLHGPRLCIYASTAVHSSLQKAVEVLGMGNRSLRRVAVDAEYGIDMDALRAAIKEDRAAGMRPICIVGTAGTTDTGAIDDLPALADLCAAEDLWFHVDAAYGAILAFSSEHRARVAGMERADSLAFDLHKWMCLPYEIGGLLVRSEAEHRGAFELTAPYLEPADQGAAVDDVPYRDYGIQLSRSFRALKAWLSIKAEGIDKFAQIVEQNIAQANHLAALCVAEAELELCAPVTLNVVCFRHRAAGKSSAEREEFNRRLLIEIQESGVAMLSSTVLETGFCLRAAITNHRTKIQDLDMLVAEVSLMGARLLAGSCSN